MTFKPNDRCYSYIQRIVFPNELIFCTCVYIILANKFAKGIIYFLCTKNPFFIFWVTKVGFFVKDIPNIWYQLESLYFCKILDHILFTINQSLHVKFFYIPLLKRQISTDSVGMGSNLNYMCLIVCSLFFYKNHF